MDAFYSCTELSSVTIPNSVKTVDVAAFSGCTGMTSLTIKGDNLARLGSGAFSSCYLIKEVNYLTESPREVGFIVVFSNITYNNATLYVSENVNPGIFARIEPWKRFKNIETYTATGINNIASDVVENLPCEVYSLSGIRIASTTNGLQPGIYIVLQGNKAKKIAVK